MDRITYKIKNGEIVKGVIFNIFLNHGNFTLVDLKVYADGELDCLGSITMEKLEEYLKSGKLTRTLPSKAKIFIPYLGHLFTDNFVSENHSIEWFLGLVKYQIDKLKLDNDIPSNCIINFKEWLIEPNETNFEKLKSAYQKLPNDQKRLFEMIDSKDPLIEIMNSNIKNLTKEQREYYLNDYFEGEWIELK